MRSTSEQQKTVKDFMNVTQTSETTAKNYLKSNSWNLEASVNAFFGKHPNRMETVSQSKSIFALETLFEEYKEPNEDLILVDGTIKYCEDLEVDPTDIVMLIVSYELKCETMCEFKKDPFISGWKELNCFSLEDMKNKLPYLREKLNDQAYFKKIYLYAFTFGKNQGQRSLNYETAIGLWKLLLEGRYPHLELWCQFVLEEHKKAISKDVWNLFLDFTTTVDLEFKEYDELSAWPVLYDQFVEYARKKIAN
ncbi:DUF298-domain-containing protein [Neoconidiobolus thromboides FSU 785]|nr:DUF298-domain-containing protein [Neoconidiobolus thromboides FSU 785]